MILFTRLFNLRNRKDSERGLTLTELLVSMGLLVLVAGVALAILLQTTANSSRFGQNTANQTEVANAISIINRDISTATSVQRAGNSVIELRSAEDSRGYTVKIFGYDPSKADKGLPSDFTVNTGNLPTFPAIIEQRQQDGAGTMTQNVLVPGWTSANQSTSLFTYYTQSDSQLQPEVDNKLVPAVVGDVTRVEFFISAKVSDRSSNIELAGSATLHSVGTLGIGAKVFAPVPIAPVLRGTLAEGERTAHLTWEITGGATSYTLYRKVNGGPYEVRAILSDPDIRNFDDSQNIDWGNIYTYYIVAFGSGGPSANSNEVPLTVVPDKVQIVNINTYAQLDDVYPGRDNTSNPANGYTYTVARDLTNQITWQPVNGATGYYVFRDGSSTPMSGTPVGSDVHSVRDTGVTYGDVHTYTVQAFNQGANCTVTVIYPQANVCDGKVSDGVSLISPPTKPTISAVNNNVTNRDSQPTNTVRLDGLGNGNGTNVYGYDLYSNSQRSTDGNCGNLNGTGQKFGLSAGSTVTNNVGWGTSTCYGAKAYNDAGSSPMSDPRTVEQGPSSFSFQNVNSSAPLVDGNGTRYTVARDNVNQITWNESYGADTYRVYGKASGDPGDYRLLATLGGDQRMWSENTTNGDRNSYYVTATTDHNGKKAQTGTVELTAPPTAPIISAVANDDSTNSKSANYVYVNDYGRNAAGVSIFRNQQAASNPQCTTNSTLTNSANGSNYDGNADWGSSTCYYARAYNDAGVSPMSNTATADQLPGKFAFNYWQNTRDYLANYSENRPGEGFSNASNNNNDGTSSKVNQSLSYNIKWSSSLGSQKYNLIYGYKKDNNSSRSDYWQNNGYDTCQSSSSGIMNALMPPSVVDNTSCVASDASNSRATGDQTSNLSPGSYYRAVAIAVGNNGTRRGTSSEFATTPTIPKFASVYSYKRMVDNAGPSGSAYMARVANVALSTTFGSASSVRAYFNWNNQETDRDSGVSANWTDLHDVSQGTSNYLTVRTSGHTGTQTSFNKRSGPCRLVTDNFCDVFLTDYDSSGAASTAGRDLTAKYNSNRFTAYPGAAPPPRYQWGNDDSIYATGGAQAYLSAPSAYNYSGYSDQISWVGGISESNCYYRACNPNYTDVTAGSASGPWAGYSNNEYAGDVNHSYYFMSGLQGANPNSTTKGNPPSIADREYATGSASTGDGSLPTHDSVNNG